MKEIRDLEKKGTYIWVIFSLIGFVLMVVMSVIGDIFFEIVGGVIFLCGSRALIPPKIIFLPIPMGKTSFEEKFGEAEQIKNEERI